MSEGQVRLDGAGVTLTPPAGWVRKPDERGPSNTTIAYVSPAGGTAVGVIRFTLPWAVGREWALWGFLSRMKQREGRADLIEKTYDAKADVTRFVAEGSRYRIRTNFYVRGTAGWAVFAGTLVDKPIDATDLRNAELARDSAVIEE
ncbi:MAG TPA: hypothetical protein VF624_05200 [Tepidisphaeraceae bacterium]|jgi:hypothetical protein